MNYFFNKSYINLIGFVILFFFSFGSLAQNVKKLQSEAKENFKMDEYADALPLYLKVDSLEPNNAEVNYRIGFCYIKLNQDAKAQPYFEKAKNLHFNSPNLDYNLGVAYHANHEFDKAIACFETYIKGLDKTNASDQTEIKKANRYIEMCQNGKELMANPLKVEIQNLGNKVNSPYPDYVPVVSADETVLIFTSRRPNTTGGQVEESTGHFHEDIYISTKDSTGQWSAPENIGTEINTNGHDACVAISPDGQELFVYKSDNQDIYVSTLTGNKWSAPKKIAGLINSKYWEASASISADEKTLFFTSDRPGGFGDKDIYISTLQPNGQWGTPKNMGAELNSEYDEDAPFIHPDGKTLYFSSEGHKSMGGYDIFVSKYNEEKKTWGKPENVGYPINTAGDDIFFVWSADGTRGYFSSIRADSYGEKDIYVVSRPKVNVSLIVLKGKVFAEETEKAISATITIVDNETNKIVGITNSNSYSGKYTVILPPGKNYGVSVAATGFLPYSENVDIPKGEYFELSKDIKLKPLAKGSVAVLKNVFFDSNKSELRKESFGELDRFADVLKDNPDLCVEIAGHTDNVGDANYNLKLSDDRAKSVVSYLVSKGISISRLYPVGYGKEVPVATNETEEGKQLNRRTELIITEKAKEGQKITRLNGFYHQQSSK